MTEVEIGSRLKFSLLRELKEICKSELLFVVCGFLDSMSNFRLSKVLGMPKLSAINSGLPPELLPVDARPEKRDRKLSSEQLSTPEFHKFVNTKSLYSKMHPEVFSIEDNDLEDFANMKSCRYLRIYRPTPFLCQRFASKLRNVEVLWIKIVSTDIDYIDPEVEMPNLKVVIIEQGFFSPIPRFDIHRFHRLIRNATEMHILGDGSFWYPEIKKRKRDDEIKMIRLIPENIKFVKLSHMKFGKLKADVSPFPKKLLELRIIGKNCKMLKKLDTFLEQTEIEALSIPLLHPTHLECATSLKVKKLKIGMFSEHDSNGIRTYGSINIKALSDSIGVFEIGFVHDMKVGFDVKLRSLIIPGSIICKTDFGKSEIQTLNYTGEVGSEIKCVTVPKSTELIVNHYVGDLYSLTDLLDKNKSLEFINIRQTLREIALKWYVDGNTMINFASIISEAESDNESDDEEL